MKKIILSVLAVSVFASCEPIEPIGEFALEYEMYAVAPPITTENNESLMPIIQATGTISPFKLLRKQQVTDSLINQCDCDSVFTQTIAI